MRVAVIGAGIAGLAAARTLNQHGVAVVVYEKSRGVGGRVATRRSNGFVWDTGATSIAPRGRAIERVIRQELSTDGLVEIARPIYVHEGLRVVPGDRSRLGTRFTYTTGTRTLAQRLADGLEIRLEQTIAELDRTGDRFLVEGDVFDAVVLTPPVPQTAALLWGLDESRPLAPAVYRPCLSVNLGFAAPNPDVPYWALIDGERSHPLVWLSIESLKSPERAPEGHCAIGLQFSPTFSRENWTRSEADLIQMAGEFTERLFGPAYEKPVASTVMRWKYAQPTGIASFDDVNPEGARLLIASDGLLGGHIEEAFDVGVLAAQRLLA